MREIRREAWYGERNRDIQLIGCTPAYFEINRLEMDRGRFLSDRDLESTDNVCVIASGAAEHFFPYENPIGRRLLIDEDYYTIIGQTKNRQASASIGGSFEGRDYNFDIYIPLSTLRARIGDQVITSSAGSREGELVELSQITVTVDDINHVEETADIVKILLEKVPQRLGLLDHRPQGTLKASRDGADDVQRPVGADRGHLAGGRRASGL